MNKNYILFFFLFLIISCSKPKTVLICGDHVCINKDEANQYFEENLMLEVKVLNVKAKNEIDLIELHMNNSSDEKKEINIIKKNVTKNKLRNLSKKEKEIIRLDLKKKEIKKSKEKKKATKEKKIIKYNNKTNKLVEKSEFNKYNLERNFNKKNSFDVCKIIEECNIDEISKFLINYGKKKEYPDITLKENKL